MPLGTFANQTDLKCTAPLFDETQFSKTGAYTLGRYCGLGSFEDGTTCCFPCPIQDWLYPPKWQQQLRIPNYLSLLSVILCCFLLFSFAVLPPEQTHRHYLSVGLLFPVLFISLSFAIPLSTDPPLCYDAITPNDMRSSMSCAWTGSLVSLGGLGCVVWVFLRSLWLHIRIFWDRDPGRKFKWGSIVFGILVPLILWIIVMLVTGFSYRMGQTCLPNREHATVTFWIWLVVFAILGFLLQTITTAYCFFVYMRTLRRERRTSTGNSFQHRQARRKQETWVNVKRLFLLQWRNILVSIFVIIGSISFFLVFWTQDSKLGRVFNDPKNIKPVKTWIICQTLSRGDKQECRKYVKNFTVDQTAVLTSLVLASLVGIEIFILLFRRSMITAWATLFRRSFHLLKKGRPPTPQLTSLENPDKYLPPSPRKRPPFFSAFSAEDSSTDASSSTNIPATNTTIAKANATELNTLSQRPTFERVTSETGLLQPDGPGSQRFQSFFDTASSAADSAPNSRAETPTPLATPLGAQATEPLDTLDPQPSTRRLSQIQPLPRSYTPSRSPPPPPRTLSAASRFSAQNFSLPRTASPPPRTATKGSRDSTWSGLSIQKTNSSKLRGRISTPIPGTFVHVNGAFQDGRERDLGELAEGRIEEGEEGERWRFESV